MDFYLNGQLAVSQSCINNYCDVKDIIRTQLNIGEADYYLLQNGKRVTYDTELSNTSSIHIVLRVNGGKGGFGSMLRAIGAQIEKTTNREACRDLSGRRLRDINEEKRVKTWLEKQKEREEESEDKKKKKLERMLVPPKHDFKDEAYEKAMTDLTEQVGDAVDQGFKKADETKEAVKRKHENAKDGKKIKKKKKGAMWLLDDMSSCSDDTDSDSDSGNSTKSAHSVSAASTSSKTSTAVQSCNEDSVDVPK